MGLSHWFDYLEAEPLNLKAEHFPLPCALRELVLEHCASPQMHGTGMQAMDIEELLEYLCNPGDPSLSPMQGILAQTESIGDPALPGPDHAAILNWLGAAFDIWEREFPLEPPLPTELRRLQPLAAVLAVTDPQFLVPGGHPLHVILDKLQQGAVGWQARLGRAGQAFQKQLGDTIDAALLWLEDKDTDLDKLSAQVVATTERGLARAERMIQRMIETEQGRIRTAEAKRVAANMINAALQQYPVPDAIGTFLKGPWYDSAQLALLKFGARSEQWQQMSDTTTTLLSSLQAAGIEDPGQRQHLFQLVTRLPRELKRWLLSLQHDSGAIDEAMGNIEFAHMQLLRKRPLELQQTALIPVDDTGRKNTMQEGTVAAQVGQWFAVDSGDGDPVRVRLVLRIEDAGELLFANQAGIKVMQKSFGEFIRLLETGKVLALDSGASFSRALALAAGITTNDDLEALAGAAALKAKREEGERLQREQAQREREQEEANRLQQEREEAGRQQRERDEAERLAQQQEEAERQQIEQDRAIRLEQEQEEAQRLEYLREQAVRLARQQAEAVQSPEAEDAQSLQIEELEAETLQREWDEAQRLQQQRREAETRQPERSAAVPTPATVHSLAKHGDVASPRYEEMVETVQGPTLAAQAVDTGTADRIHLAMGTWLGFHDGDMPLLAKLAVHDREQDNYIFVNRSGIKMRQLGARELLTLIDRGLVDILEARSSFRDEISRAKNKQED